MDQNDLWNEFEQFRFLQISDLWASEILDKPFGKIVFLDKSDDMSMLWAGTVKEQAFEEILKDVELEVHSRNLETGFNFSPSWTGDIDTFKEFLISKKYNQKYATNYLIKDIHQEDVFEESSIVEQVIHHEDYCKIIAIGFGEGLSRIAEKQFYRKYEKLGHEFFLAYKDGMAVGCGALSYDETFGYLHSLAVDPGWRGRGIGSALVRHRLKVLQNRKIPYATTAVATTNKASLAVQKKNNYRFFAETTTWGSRESEH